MKEERRKPKICVLCYHKNASKLYPEKWIDAYRQSVLNQTYKNFDIIENNYGGDNYKIFDRDYFHPIIFSTFVHCVNSMLDFCFNTVGYDYVFNTNVDDYYAINRIERQLLFLEQGYDIVASNFHLIRDDRIYHSHRMNEQNIALELSRNNNPIGHPVVAYSRKFWENKRYNPSEIPMEDMRLWQRAIKSGSKFIILPDFLLYHRVHNQSVCQNSENR